MMTYAVISVGDRFQTVWTGNGPFSAAFNLFKTKVLVLESCRDIQLVEIAGITSDKNIKRNVLVDKILFAEHRIKSYAATIGNSELAQSINYNPSRLLHTSQAELSGIANAVIAKAQANVTALAPYGLTAQVITDMQAAVTSFNTALPRPRTAKVMRKNATETLKLIFAEIDSLLIDRLDHDIEVYKTLKPDFYSQYKAARLIISTASRNLSLKASAVLDATGKPIHNVHFAFTRKADNVVIAIKKTSEKGHFLLKNISEGEYEVKVQKTGFKEQTISVTAVDGEMTNINVVMEAA